MSFSSKNLSILNESISEKHSRQILIPEIGYEGHVKLRNSKVLVVGAGGLGIPASMYLASSGIGKIGIVDNDLIELSNLGRQILYAAQDIGKKKSTILCEKLFSLNQDVRFIPYDLYFSQENASKIAQDYDIILNGSDNLKTRFVINEVAHKLQIPWVNIAATQLDGQITAYLPNHGCFACLFSSQQATTNDNCAASTENTISSCATQGILAPLCGMFGSWGATLAMNILLGMHSSDNLFYHFDSRTNSLKNFKWKKNHQCPVCSLSSQNNHNADIQKSKNRNSLTKCELLSLIEQKKNVVLIDLSMYKKLNLDICVENIRIKFEDFFSKDLEEPTFVRYLNNEFTYVCHCDFGVKSKIAAEILQQEGFCGYSLIEE